MKSILFGLFLFCTLSGYCQSIPNHAKTIVVKGVTFMQACNALLDSGYTIQKKDNELQTAITEPKEYPKYWNTTYQIVVRVKDSICYLTGKTGSILAGEPDFEYIVNKKGQPISKGIVTYPFILLNRFAKGFGKEIEYK